MYFAQPTSSFGYYRGSPQFMGGAATGGGSGPQMAGTNTFSQGQGPQQSGKAWSPDILYMIGLILLEMVVFGILSRKF
jgi:hypothetical protein